MLSRREIDKTFAMESYQNFPTSHILETTICLNPVPFIAEDFGDLSAAFVPMVVDSSLNQPKLSLCDRPFSDSNGYYSHYIAEQKRGRQQKMHGSEKSSMAGIWWGD